MKLSDFKKFEVKGITKLIGGDVIQSCKQDDGSTLLTHDTSTDEDTSRILKDRFDGNSRDPFLG